MVGPQTTTAQWISAYTGLGTAGVALVALVFGGLQVRQARRARELVAELDRKRSQPAVSVFMERSGSSLGAFDIVVRNFGPTPARELALVIDPHPVRAPRTEGGQPEEIALPKLIPYLAPGQEFRTLWDVSHLHLNAALPERHDGRVQFAGIDGESLSSDFVLDWSIYRSVRTLQVLGEHDSAKALKEVAASVRRWTEAGALRVITRSGHVRDEADRRFEERWRRDNGQQPRRAHFKRRQPR